MTAAQEAVELVYSERRCPTDAEIDLVIREGDERAVGALACKFGMGHHPLYKRYKDLVHERLKVHG